MLRSDTKTRDPRPALALTYAADFGHMGIVMPFLAPWLLGRGLGPVAIGLLLALPPLFKIAAPWSWGRWADRSGHRRELMLVAALVSGAATAALVGARRFWPIAALVAIYGFARAPILPYLEATALEQSERHRFAYGPIRLWGSVAFIVSSSGFGLVATEGSLDAGLLLAAAMLAICAVGAVAMPAPLPRPAPVAAPGPNRRPGDRAGLVRFFAACALMQASHGAYYTFYSIRLQDLGYGEAAIGALWALAVLCEVLVLTRTDRIVRWLGSGRVLRVCLVLAAARWLLIGSTESAGLLVVAQVLHAATYAAFHVAAIRVVYDRFGERARAEGQAMYSGMTFGLGLFVGSLAAGWLTAAIGLPAVFRVSAGVAVVALLVLGRTATPRPHDRQGSRAAVS